MEGAAQLQLGAKPIAAVRTGRQVVTGLPTNLRRSICNGLTFRNPKYAEAQRMGFWTGKIPPHLQFFRHDARAGTLVVPQGVDLDKLCRSAGVPVKVDDQTTAPPAKLELAGELRPYQERAVAHLLERDSGTLVAPTGSGKTVMGCAIAAARGVRTLVLVHTKPLLEQWQRAVGEWLGVEAGAIGAGKSREGAEMTIATIQTLSRRGTDELGDYGLVLVDEAHHSPALTWTAVIGGIAARHRVALSATPWRKDGLEFILPLVFGSHRAEVTREEVQGAGGVVPTKVSFVWTNCDYPWVEDWAGLIDAVIDDEQRNELVAHLAETSAEMVSTLVLTDRVEHAARLAAATGGVLLHGQIGKRDRDDAMVAIAGGANLTVATTGILGEGVDVASWGTLVLAVPMGSRSPRVLQAVGRVVRPAPGKTGAMVFDMVDGHPLAQGAYRGRRALYRRQGIEEATG